MLAKPKEPQISLPKCWQGCVKLAVHLWVPINRVS